MKDSYLIAVCVTLYTRILVSVGREQVRRLAITYCRYIPIELVLPSVSMYYIPRSKVSEGLNIDVMEAVVREINGLDVFEHGELEGS